MAPLELLSKRQAVVFKAPCAYIGPPAIYIGLEPVLEKKKNPYFFVGLSNKKNIDFLFPQELAPDLYRWPGNRYRHMEP